MKNHFTEVVLIDVCYDIVNIVKYMHELNADLLDHAIVFQFLEQECGV